MRLSSTGAATADVDVAAALAEFGWEALLFAVGALLVDAHGQATAVPVGRIPWAGAALVRTERVDGLPSGGRGPALRHTDNWLLVEALLRRTATVAAAQPQPHRPSTLEVRPSNAPVLYRAQAIHSPHAAFFPPFPSLPASCLII